MSTKVYVENLSAATTENDLINLFSSYGNVVDANIVVDPINRKSRCLGFVTMVTPEGARAAIQALHGKQMAAHILIMNEGGPRRERAGVAEPCLKDAS